MGTITHNVSIASDYELLLRKVEMMFYCCHFWKLSTWSFVGPISLWTNAIWWKHSFLVATSHQSGYNRCDGRFATCKSQLAISSRCSTRISRTGSSPGCCTPTCCDSSLAQVDLPEPVENEVAQPPSLERLLSLIGDLRFSNCSFSNCSDDSSSNETLEDANRLSKTPHRIAEAEHRLWAEAIPTTSNLQSAFCEQTYIQLIIAKLVLNERELSRELHVFNQLWVPIVV